MRDLSVDVEIGPVLALPVNSAAGITQLIGGGVILRGWSLRETSGAAAATAEFSSGGQVVGEAGIAAGLAYSHSIASNGVMCPSGLSVTETSGAWTGCVYYTTY